MSINDAVVAIKALKAELAATRRSKAEVEAVNHGLAEELRLAREGQTLSNGKFASSDEHCAHAPPVVNSSNDDARSVATVMPAENEPTSAQELLEAQTALRETLSEKQRLEAQAAELQQILDNLRVKSEEAAISADCKVAEALAARDEAHSLGEQARTEAARQKQLAARAESQCSGLMSKVDRVTEEANLLRKQLEETSEELKKAKDAVAAEDTGVEGRQDMGDTDAAAELESELRSVQGVVSHQDDSNERAIDDSAAATATSAMMNGMEKLRAELDRTINENQELRESLEAAKADLTAAALANKTEAAVGTDAPADTEGDAAALAKTVEEVASLTARLSAAEDKREAAEDKREAAEGALAEEKQGREKEVSLVRSALLEVQEEMESLKAKLARAIEDREEDTRRFESEKSIIADERVSFLEAELERTRAQAAQADERVRLAEEGAAATAAAFAAEKEQASAAASSLTAEVEDALRDAEAVADALREEHRDALMVEAEKQRIQQAEAEATAAASRAEIEGALKAKEAAEDAARELKVRAEKLQKTVGKLKSQVAEAKKNVVKAEEEAKRTAAEDREKAAVELGKMEAAKLEVEETLLIANNELQRLQGKLEEAQASAAPARAESERLAGELETLRTSTAAESVAAAEAAQAALDAARSDAQRAAKEEIEQAMEIARKAELAGNAAAQEVVELKKQLLERVEDARQMSAAVRNSRDAEKGTERQHEMDEGEGASRQTDPGGEGVWKEDRGGDGEPGETKTMRAVVDQRDRLQSELRTARREAGVRTAALETQLADTEREAADTQRRLYRQQTQLETELEELRASHDALRVEIARMDASMQDAAERHASVSGGKTSEMGGIPTVINGPSSASAGSTRGGRDAEAIGAGLGASVGGIFRGTFWPGFRGGGGNGSAAGLENEKSAAAAAAADGVQERGEMRRGRGGKWRTDQRTAGASRETGVDPDRESFSRVRENMMARLQEAANPPPTAESNVDKNKINKSSSSNSGGSSGGGGGGGGDNKEHPDSAAATAKKTARVDTGERDTNDDEQDAEKATGAFVGRSRRTNTGEDRDESSTSVHDDAPREDVGNLEDDEWKEETTEHPPPGYGMDSPVIRYLLHQWSSDPEKLKYLTLWLRCVTERRRVPDAFPSGLQLVGLAPEIKDGFLTLIIPMIRHKGGVPVWVHSRRAPPETGETSERWDLRVKVELPGGGLLASGGGFGAGSTENEPTGGRERGGGALSGRVEQQLSPMQDRRGVENEARRERWKPQGSR